MWLWFPSYQQRLSDRDAHRGHPDLGRPNPKSVGTLVNDQEARTKKNCASPPGPIVPDINDSVTYSGVEKVAFSVGSRKARFCSSRRQDGGRTAFGRVKGSSDAPAVTLGVLQGALHLVSKHFRESRAGDSAGARLSDIWRAIPTAQDAKQGLLDPVSLQ